MSAPKGNEFWKVRAKHGREKFITSIELLKESCLEYFQWVEDNPLQEEKLFSFQGVVTKETVSKMRAMTIEGLCVFLDITAHTWRNWRTDKEYLPVIEWAESIMRQQKFAGAAADMLNANIIARDLGLRDAQDNINTNLNKEVAPDTDLDKEVLDRYFETKGKPKKDTE